MRSWRRANIQVKLIRTFAAIALLLAALGLFGLPAFTVVQRVREIGVRMALGARQAQVLRETLSEGLALVSLGLVVGVIASVPLARAVRQHVLRRIRRRPSNDCRSRIVLLFAGLAACYIPARAAAAVDPMEALRYE